MAIHILPCCFKPFHAHWGPPIVQIRIWDSFSQVLEYLELKQWISKQTFSVRGFSAAPESPRSLLAQPMTMPIYAHLYPSIPFQTYPTGIHAHICLHLCLSMPFHSRFHFFHANPYPLPNGWQTEITVVLMYKNLTRFTALQLSCSICYTMRTNIRPTDI